MAKLSTILVVDDNARCVELLSVAFAEAGVANVLTETDSTKVIARIHDDAPNLVLLDLKMPAIDGFDVLAAVRAHGDLVPIVLCSGSALQADVNKAYACGCNGYLEKPASLTGYRDLAKVVSHYWGQSELPTR